MCERAVEESRRSLEFVPDHLKIGEMCEKAVEVVPYMLEDVPDHLKTQEICIEAVSDKPYTLRYVVDWFVTQEQIDLWDDDIFFKRYKAEWYEGCQKRKAQKGKK